MNLELFIEQLKSTPETLQFEDTMSVIDSLYIFTETAFKNGKLENKAGENSGSCRLFSFAQKQTFSKQQTLHCFGQYYQEVLASPDGESHQNIRQFMENGWDKISFEQTVLALK